MNQDSNISVLLNHFDYGQKAYLSFVLPCGFCCRNAVFEKNSAPQVVNQAFPEIFANYASLYAEKDCKIKLPFEIYRNVLLILYNADIENARKEIERIHSVLFYLPPDEEVFNLAKTKAVSSMKERYKKINYRALYKMLEFSESEKGFHFSKLAKDMAELDFAVFCRYLACFVQPQNCILLASGNFENMAPELSLKKCARTSEVPRPCFYNRKIDFGNDFYIVQPDIADYSAGCIKFAFKGEGISATEQYFLLSLLAGVLFQKDYSVHVDAADANIIYWAHKISEYKYHLTESLDNPQICDVSAQLLYSLYSMQNKQPEKFLSFWSNLLIDGINIKQYIHLLETCSREDILKLFRKSDPIVCEGSVFLRAEDTYGPDHH